MPLIITDVVKAAKLTSKPLPVYLSRVEAGFPSPADDYMEGVLDLNDLCIENEAATFFLRARGDSMIGAGIHDGDLLIVDRSKEVRGGEVVVAALGGDLTVKRIDRIDGRLYLLPENEEHMPIEVDVELEIWGVVTHVIHDVE